MYPVLTGMWVEGVGLIPPSSLDAHLPDGNIQRVAMDECRQLDALVISMWTGEELNIV